MYFQPSQVTIQLNCNQFNWKITWVATLISITSLYAHFCNWTSSTKWPVCVSVSVYHKCHYPINQLECLVSVCAWVSGEWICMRLNGGGGGMRAVFLVCFWDDDLNENYNHFACRWPNTFVADRIDTCCDGAWSPRSSLPHDIDSPVACVSIVWRSLYNPRSWWRRNDGRTHDRRTQGKVLRRKGRRLQRRNWLRFLLLRRRPRLLHCCCYCCRLSDSGPMLWVL